MRGVPLGIVLALIGSVATVAITLIEHGLVVQLVWLAAAVVLAGGVGFMQGAGHVMQSMRDDLDDMMATCVGGPMDGARLPAPPGNDVDFVVVSPEHPEGAYRLDGDRLIWEEEVSE